MRWTGLKKNLSKSSVANDRKTYIDPGNRRITVKRQAELLTVNRTSIYRKRAPKLWSENDLWLMRRIDELHTDEPTWGYRMLTRVLRRETGWIINRKKVRRLMRIIGIYTIFPKPNLSKRFHAQYIRPYLLRNVTIVEPDQVWGVDITYIRMQKGFMYLFVIIDWYSRMIIDYELSSTLEKTFVLACLNRALAKRRPQIINSDQGGHFTNPEYIALLEKANVKISMDGKGQCLDNAKTERFFRTLKYDRIYVEEYNTPRELRGMLKSYISKYNHYRPHSSNGGRTPAEVYFGNTLEKVIA